MTYALYLKLETLHEAMIRNDFLAMFQSTMVKLFKQEAIGS